MAESIITLQAVRQHLRLDDDYPAEQLEVYLSAAVEAASNYLNRRIYADEQERTQAIAGAPAVLQAAVDAHAAAVAVAATVGDCRSRDAALTDAEAALREAHAVAVETRRGLVINPAIRAAILLTAGHLFANREDTLEGQAVEVPNGCRALLQPYRIGLGV